MGLFEGCLLAADIDGTLMNNNEIAARNIEMIRVFTKEGGLFSFATGRSVGAVEPVLQKLGHVSPSVMANGCMIYDYDHQTVLEQQILSRQAHEIVPLMLKTGIEVGIEVHTGARVITIAETEETRAHQEYEWLQAETLSFEEADGLDWNKVVYLFAGPEEREKAKQAIGNTVLSSAFSDTTAMIAGRQRYYYEQFPKGISKASAVLRLCDLLGIERNHLFTIGDYYNDMELIRCGAESAATAEAPEEVRACAGFVTGACEQGAVADFIEYLISGKE